MEVSATKGEFAAMIGVTPGRVSQYLTEGKIRATSLEGVGRGARIIVERAKADLRLTLDVSQRLGNGFETRLDPSQTPTGEQPGQTYTQPPSVAPPTLGGVDYEIKQHKLDQLRRANRNAAIADAQNSGLLMETDAARAGKAKVANAMLLVFEGGLTEFATAIAAEFKVPQRDVLHLLRREFRKIRESAAKQARAEAVQLSATVETVLEVEEIEAIN